MLFTFFIAMVVFIAGFAVANQKDQTRWAFLIIGVLVSFFLLIDTHKKDVSAGRPISIRDVPYGAYQVLAVDKSGQDVNVLVWGQNSDRHLGEHKKVICIAVPFNQWKVESQHPDSIFILESWFGSDNSLIYATDRNPY